ncbi:MAG: DUF3027 domain-containing protein [Microbacterium sp.]|uniref:DUF3027 domain-containing protein n=1 Tax=Microbacterium sp. TaxID=51671 RepID=UPI0039E5D4B0
MSSTPDAGDASEDERGVVAPEPAVPDERLLAAHDLALAALYEITPAATVGAPADYALEADGVVSLRFETTLPGYPGWFWTVSLAAIEDAEPTVLEVELLPGETALVAPEWVPWAVRLAEYRAQQAAAVEAAAAEALADPDAADEDVDLGEDDDLDDEDADDDFDDLDAADFDTDGSPILHSGDVDGVDIDELDEDADRDEV